VSDDEPTMYHDLAGVHEDIELTEDNTLGIPDGTELVNGNRHSNSWKDVTWIDRRSRWGNPFKTEEDGGEYTRRESVNLYRGWFHGEVKKGNLEPRVLRGETLACWCVPYACHGVIILNFLAETYDEQQTLGDGGGGGVERD